MAYNQNPDYAKLGDVAALSRSFVSYLSASTANITGDGTLVLVPFDTTIYNEGNFDTSTSIYTADADGLYFFSHTVALVGGDIDTINYITCWDGDAWGTRAFQLSPSPQAGTNTTILSANIIIRMNTGEAMKVTCLAGGVNKNVNIYGGVPAALAVTSTFSGGCMKLL